MNSFWTQFTFGELCPSWILSLIPALIRCCHIPHHFRRRDAVFLHKSMRFLNINNPIMQFTLPAYMQIIPPKINIITGKPVYRLDLRVSLVLRSEDSLPGRLLTFGMEIIGERIAYLSLYSRYTNRYFRFHSCSYRDGLFFSSGPTQQLEQLIL